jgi:ComEC/Rec2-related protein
MKPIEGWPRQPFVGLALAAGLGILCADFAPYYSSTILVALGVLALIALIWGSSLATYAVVTLGFFLLHSLRLIDSAGLRLAREIGEQPQAVTARGFVISDPKISPKGTASFLLRLTSMERRDGVSSTPKVTIFARWRGPVEFGDEVNLFGVIQPVAPPRNPGEFDLRAYLARRDVHQILLVRYPENGAVLGHSGGHPILRAAKTTRTWMQSTLSRGLEDSPEIQGLISGMVLGALEKAPEEIEEQFQQTGTLHLFAVSGLNVAIVAQLLWTLGRAARLSRRWAIALIIPSLFFYAAVTGFNTSSVRAALMAAVLLGGFFADRKVFAGNSLAAAAVLILCFDSHQLFSTGFQLSFAVVTAIILLAVPIYKFLNRWCASDQFLPAALVNPIRRLEQQSWSAIALGASVSFAAWIGSLPLILWYFNLVTPISLFANLVVVPLAFLVLAVGLMSLLAAPITALVIVFNNANWTLASAILAAVNLFAQAPGGHFYLERPHFPDGTRAEITVLDLGAGAAVHVRIPANDWLFDSGSEGDFAPVLQGYLRSRGIDRLDAVLLSHGDAGHIGGARAVLDDFRPRTWIDTAARDRSRVHRDLITGLSKEGITRTFCAAGDELRLSREVTGRILFPPRGFQAKIADDQALVVQLTLARNFRVLLMSDSGVATERSLLASGMDLRSDIIIKGQHHSGTSGSPEFLDAVRPRLIIATSRDFAENQRIKDDWAEMVKTRGIKLFRQDETGAVDVRFFRDRWEAIPYLGSETFRSTVLGIRSPQHENNKPSPLSRPLSK